MDTRLQVSAHCSVALLTFALAACKPKEAQIVADASRALSAVAAEETVKLAGSNKRIITIVPDASWGPASSVVRDFEADLKKRGLAIQQIAVNVGDPMSRDVGLKAQDFLAALAKSADAGAVVSFAGAPLLKADQAENASPHAPVLIVATAMLGNVQGLPGDRTQIARMLDSRLIQLAIIDGSDPSAAKSAKPDTVHDVFNQNYRVLRASNRTSDEHLVRLARP